MSNTNLSPLDREHIKTEIEICNLIINYTDELIRANPKLDDTHIWDEYKAELQYIVDTKTNQLKLDKKNSK